MHALHFQCTIHSSSDAVVNLQLQQTANLQTYTRGKTYPSNKIMQFVIAIVYAPVCTVGARIKADPL